jgi:plastocyanin
MKQKLLILGLVIVLPLCFVLMGQVERNKQAHKYSDSVTIQLDKNGFSPKKLTVSVDTVVHWKNVSGAPQTVNSNDYPTNQLHRDLNFGVFNSGSTFVYVFSVPGTYAYHNQFHPEQQGTISVTK